MVTKLFDPRYPVKENSMTSCGYISPVMKSGGKMTPKEVKIAAGDGMKYACDETMSNSMSYRRRLLSRMR